MSIRKPIQQRGQTDDLFACLSRSQLFDVCNIQVVRRHRLLGSGFGSTRNVVTVVLVLVVLATFPGYFLLDSDSTAIAATVLLILLLNRCTRSFRLPV